MRQRHKKHDVKIILGFICYSHVDWNLTFDCSVTFIWRNICGLLLHRRQIGNLFYVFTMQTVFLWSANILLLGYIQSRRGTSVNLLVERFQCESIRKNEKQKIGVNGVRRCTMAERQHCSRSLSLFVFVFFLFSFSLSDTALEKTRRLSRDQKHSLWAPHTEWWCSSFLYRMRCRSQSVSMTTPFSEWDKEWRRSTWRCSKCLVYYERMLVGVPLSVFFLLKFLSSY